MENNNFFVAIALSIAILVGFHYLYDVPMAQRAVQQAKLAQKVQEAPVRTSASDEISLRSRAEIVAQGGRVRIETKEVRGSIRLEGGRIDDLELVNYRETVDANAQRIVLLSPAASAAPHRGYFATFGWLAGQDAAVPTDETVWKTDDKVLTPETPVLLTWNNGKGLLFERKMEVDDGFLFTVTDRVRNVGNQPVTLYPFGAVTRYGMPQVESTYVLHEGPLGVLGGTLKEIDYADLVQEPKTTEESEGGWLGFTDKYWLVALVPPQDEKIIAGFSFDAAGHPEDATKGIFQTDFRGRSLSLAPGAGGERTLRLFAGAKRVSLLDSYAEKLDIPLFDRAIDFGWYYYLTKPFLYLLHELSQMFGSMALAIVMFTIMLKIATLPLSLKSTRSMAKLKELQPAIKEIQERYKEDKQKASLEMMELYKREKVSPASGCVPVLIQIPIFFALYKVLYVGIEMRHAPLFGWIKDMSAPDPTSVLTFFGALDVSFIPHVGIWPVLMGVSMYLQQKLSPQPTDKSQAQIFQFLPLIFTFMMAKVAVGLIFYWTISNILGIGQQWYVMRKTKPRVA